MGKKNPVECFGDYGSTDDCFGCPVADECEDFTIECEIDEIDAEITKEEDTRLKIISKKSQTASRRGI